MKLALKNAQRLYYSFLQQLKGQQRYRGPKLKFLSDVGKAII